METHTHKHIYMVKELHLSLLTTLSSTDSQQPILINILGNPGIPIT